MTYLKAMQTFFGQNRGEKQQTLQEFSQELKALTHEDKLYFVNEFNKRGMQVDPPSAPQDGK